MKRCSRCKTEKPVDQFAKMTAAKDGRQARCRECARAIYLAAKDAPKKKQAGPRTHRTQHEMERDAAIQAEKQRKAEARRELWAGARDMYSGCGRA